MSGSAAANTGHQPVPVFRISLWVITLAAFAELITAGVAIAIRIEDAREVRVIERIVPHIVAVPTPVAALPGNDSPGQISAVPPVGGGIKPTVPAAPPLPPPTPLNTPSIADPVVERLVTEARQARVAEDLRLALVKLEEAQQSAPGDPNVLYELALAYELMGVYDRAADYYQKVLELGTSGAGSLYELAGLKLRDGFEQPEEKRGRMSLGRVRVFRDQRSSNERVVLTVPIQAVPGEKINPTDLEIVVRFFDEVGDGEPQPASPQSSTNYEWVSGNVDWQAGEELLRVTYTLPDQDIQQRHLFGVRGYYGQVVELVYRGTLIDSQAWPRILARKVDAPERDPLFLDRDLLPPDFNPDAPLLPPPLPER